MFNRISIRKRNIEKLWFYCANILTAIGAISLVENLKSWRRFTLWVFDGLKSIAPEISEIFISLANSFLLVIEAYRVVAHPALRWLLSWIPIHFPPTAM